MVEEELEKIFNQGKDPCYLIHGEESLLIEEAAQWLYHKALGDGAEDFNVDRFSADDSQFSMDMLIILINNM